MPLELPTAQQDPIAFQEAAEQIDAAMKNGTPSTKAYLRAAMQMGVVLRDMVSATPQPLAVQMDAIRNILSSFRCAMTAITLARLDEAIQDVPAANPFDLMEIMGQTALREEIEAGRRLHTIFSLYKEFEGTDITAQFEAALKAGPKK